MKVSDPQSLSISEGRFEDSSVFVATRRSMRSSGNYRACSKSTAPILPTAVTSSLPPLDFQLIRQRVTVKASLQLPVIRDVKNDIESDFVASIGTRVTW